MYFILLIILYAGRVFAGGAVIFTTGHPLPLLRAAAEIIVLGLCLWGCYGLAFKKRYLEPVKWKIIYQFTLILGVATVVLTGYGQSFGMPGTPEGISLFHLFMILLPFLLFAVPVIIYAKELEEQKIP